MGWPGLLESVVRSPRGPAGAALLLAAALTGPGPARAQEAAPAQPPAAAAPIPAQPAPAPAPSPEPAGTPAMVIDNRQIESVLGRSVLSPKAEDMGRIVDVLVDRTGDLRAAVIDFGGFFGVGSRKIAVDWHSLHFKNDGKTDTIVADLPRDQLRVSPVYKEGEPVVVLGRTSTKPVAPPEPAPASPAAAGPAPASPAPATPQPPAAPAP